MASLNQTIAGLLILKNYAEDPDDPCTVAAGHDVLYAGDTRIEMSPEDEKELESLGWHKDEGFDCWAKFT